MEEDTDFAKSGFLEVDEEVWCSSLLRFGGKVEKEVVENDDDEEKLEADWKLEVDFVDACGLGALQPAACKGEQRVRRDQENE